MRREWHQLSHPGGGTAALQTSRPSTASAEDSALGLDRWRELPRLQTPPWENGDEVASVCRVLDTVPSIVAPYEVDQLRLGVQAGDAVAYYARAADNDAGGGKQATSDMYFLRIRPFGKDFKPATSMAGGGGGGGGGGQGARAQGPGDFGVRHAPAGAPPDAGASRRAARLRGPEDRRAGPA